MDDLDRSILAALRKDARISISALAQSLDVARPTVQNRITRLENSGVIAGYTIKIQTGTTPNVVRAVMSIVVDGNNAQTLVRELQSRPSVTAIHSTNGKWDLIAEIQAESLEDFDRELNAIRRLKYISSSETSILLSTYKM
jgi:DNA-binding Lrp family transcriptional regulator